MAKKKTPVNESNLAEGAFTGVDEAENFGDRLARYGQAHARSLAMLEHLRGAPEVEATKTAAGLATCGNYLHFRERSENFTAYLKTSMNPSLGSPVMGLLT